MSLNHEQISMECQTSFKRWVRFSNNINIIGDILFTAIVLLKTITVLFYLLILKHNKLVAINKIVVANKIHTKIAMYLFISNITKCDRTNDSIKIKMQRFDNLFKILVIKMFLNSNQSISYSKIKDDMLLTLKSLNFGHRVTFQTPFKHILKSSGCYLIFMELFDSIYLFKFDVVTFNIFLL